MADYRSFQLPWTRDDAQEDRFRRLWIGFLTGFLLLASLLWFIDLPERLDRAETSVPPRLAKLIIEREPPPPPPPPPPEQPTPQTPQARPEPRPQPTPADRREQARERAAAAFLPFQDQLADLRENRNVGAATAQNPLTDASRPGDLTERSIITSKVGQGSGGINTSGMSRGFGGGGGGSLSGRATTQVSSGLGGDGRAGASRTGSGGKAARSREEIELIFDRNKGAIYALYNRALRTTPTLQGKVVLELTIAPSGEVTNCRVVSSELNDEELERKLVARVKLFRFEDKDVETITTTKPIDFFPA